MNSATTSTAALAMPVTSLKQMPAPVPVPNTMGLPYGPRIKEGERQEGGRSSGRGHAALPQQRTLRALRAWQRLDGAGIGVRTVHRADRHGSAAAACRGRAEYLHLRVGGGSRIVACDHDPGAQQARVERAVRLDEQEMAEARGRGHSRAH